MNLLFKYFLLFILLSFFSCSQNAIEHSAIEKLLNEYSIALGSKSAQNVAELFHEEAQLLAEGKNAVQGRAKIQEHFIGLESIDFEENFEIKDVVQAGNLSIVRTRNSGKWNNLDKTESGSFNVNPLIFVHFKRKFSISNMSSYFLIQYLPNAFQELIGLKLILKIHFIFLHLISVSKFGSSRPP